jgi:hypothetical protein
LRNLARLAGAREPAGRRRYIATAGQIAVLLADELRVARSYLLAGTYAFLAPTSSAFGTSVLSLMGMK